jgi:site-specific DNA-cytosine methylase
VVDFCEVIGFGSGFALGAVQAGMKMVGKCEREDAFGASVAVTNRHLYGYNWEMQVDRENNGTGWDTLSADVVLGNPPCAAFSLLNRAEDTRGIDSDINWHMHALVEYAARVKPQIVAFESVQGAYYQGRDLMNALHEKLIELSGHDYTLTHVLHNNLSLGGVALRRRYFWVASRVPFGVERMDIPYVPTVDDALHDLEPLGLTWSAQPYRYPPTRWSEPLRAPDGLVDGHAIQWTPGWERAKSVADNLGGWPEGVQLEVLCREHYEKFGCLPGDKDGLNARQLGYQYLVEDDANSNGTKVYITREEHLRRRDFTMGPTQLNRLRANRHGYVITGGALTEYVHPHQLRTFTHRDCARIMGFPDDLRILPQQWNSHLGAVWGKGVPVHSGRWIADWIRRSINGNPGSMIGDPTGEDNGASVVDVTNDWRRALGDETWREYMARTR